MQAALKGSAEIGFTIVSLTVSLIAVLIPLLFMADIVGRLFREFAVTLAVTIIFSAFVSLTLTPMMAARILKHHPESEQGAVVPLVGVVLRKDHRTVRQDGSGGAASSAADAAGGRRHARAHDLSLHHRPQGLFPGAGYRRHPRHFAGARDGIVSRHVPAAAGSGQGDPPGSGGGESHLVHRRRWREHHHEQRPHSDHAEAARRARRRFRGGCDPAAAAQGAAGCPASSFTCSRCRI